MAACGGPRGPRGPVPESMKSRVDTFALQAPGLVIKARTIRVYTPPGYDAHPRERYAVLYLQDGQNLFTPGWFGDWLVDETLDTLAWDGRLRGLIVVGVDNTARRWDEYSPWVNAHMHAWVDTAFAAGSEGGEGDAYVRFLATTLKPEIDRRYRTRPDRFHTAVGGSSLGGLIALHAGLVRPDVFSKVMAMSSAIWFAEGGGPWLSNNRLLDDIRTHRPPPDERFYLDVGTAERSRNTDPDIRDESGRPVTYPRAYLQGTEAAAAALEADGVRPDNLKLVVDSGAVHGETSWSRRLGPALEWLFR